MNFVHPPSNASESETNSNNAIESKNHLLVSKFELMLDMNSH